MATRSGSEQIVAGYAQQAAKSAAQAQAAGRWHARRNVADAAAPPSQPAVRDNRPAPLGFSFYVFCLYTFILIGRPQDYVLALQSLRLAMVFTFVMAIITFAQPGTGALLARAFRERETKLYLAFYAAMALGIPFSIYRPGSFDVVVMRYVVNVAFFLLFAIHVDSVEKLKRIAVILVSSVFIFTVLSLRVGEFQVGRFATGGSMFDPNDIAFVEVSLLGFALWVLVGSFGVVAKIMALTSLLFGVLLTLYTASRGGLLGLLTFLLLFLWLKVPKVGKSFKTVMLVALLLMAYVNEDKINVDRFRTITDLEGDYNFEEGGRTDIWKRGWQLFLGSPLTGVGVDGFSAAIGIMRRDEGVTARWQAAHSAYILVLTETGIFGAIPFYLLIVRCLLTFNGMRRRAAFFENKDLGILPGALLIGFAAQLVAAFFLSQAYSMFFTLAFAMSSVLNRLAPKAETISQVVTDKEMPVRPVMTARSRPRAVSTSISR